MVTTRRRGPQPLSILSDAAAVENLVTWIVGKRVTGDPFGFHLFMSFAADRIPISERLRMLREVIAEQSADIYPELVDDLRRINEVRVHVAHSIYLRTSATNAPEYVKFKKGVAVSIPEGELRAQVADAQKRLRKVRSALTVLGHEVGLQAEPPS